MIVESIPKFFGFAYGLVMIVVIAYRWYSGRWRQTVGRLLLVISTALGFLIFAPMVPVQFQLLVLGDLQGLGAPLTVGLAGLSMVVLLTLVFGRFFCGYLCPIGAIQEIAYHAPIPKITARGRGFQVVRAGMFLLFLVLAFFSISLLVWFGIKDLFYLTLTAGTVVFCVVLFISMTLYRPFCQLVCPYGTLLSMAAWKSLYYQGRTEACINCKRSEKVCPVSGALRYMRRN